jgi:hypothetical protein
LEGFSNNVPIGDCAYPGCSTLADWGIIVRVDDLQIDASLLRITINETTINPVRN